LVANAPTCGYRDARRLKSWSGIGLDRWEAPYVPQSRQRQEAGTRPLWGSFPDNSE